MRRGIVSNTLRLYETWDKACGVAKHDETQTKWQTNTKFNAAASVVDAPQYWKIKLHLPFLDHLIVQLEDRLTTFFRVSKHNRGSCQKLKTQV